MSECAVPPKLHYISTAVDRIAIQPVPLVSPLSQQGYRCGSVGLLRVTTIVTRTSALRTHTQDCTLYPYHPYSLDYDVESRLVARPWTASVVSV